MASQPSLDPIIQFSWLVGSSFSLTEFIRVCGTRDEIIALPTTQHIQSTYIHLVYTIFKCLYTCSIASSPPLLKEQQQQQQKQIISLHFRINQTKKNNSTYHSPPFFSVRFIFFAVPFVIRSFVHLFIHSVVSVSSEMYDDVRIDGSGKNEERERESNRLLLAFGWTFVFVPIIDRINKWSCFTLWLGVFVCAGEGPTHRQSSLALAKICATHVILERFWFVLHNFSMEWVEAKKNKIKISKRNHAKFVYFLSYEWYINHLSCFDVMIWIGFE